MRVVITGSSKGIGRGLAHEFIAQGHEVVITGRSQNELDAIVNQTGGERLYAKATDTQDKQSVEALLAFAIAEMGAVDIWINNAGLARTTWSILDTPDEEIDKMVHTNILGTINCCKVIGAYLSERGEGKLFNMLGGGSDGEYFAGMGIYGTTKRALDYLTNALSKELKSTGVIVGKIRPGMIITEGVIRESMQDRANFAKRRKSANLLADKIETVAPYLVQEIIACNQTGKKIRWLTATKMLKRMLKGMFVKPEDKFKDFGL